MNEAYETEDCPTQLVTSGDDHTIKLWDVRHAMGTANPLSGGSATLCPFSDPSQDTSRLLRKWSRYYDEHKIATQHGEVIQLAEMRTDHYGNVFHVTPVSGSPGKVATCAADGYLMINDLETETSSIVYCPEGGESDGIRFRGRNMCFSHHFLGPNTGLLCTQKGLRRFDLRLSPREQSSYNLLSGLMNICKACIPWSPSTSSSSLTEGDSSYIFGM